MRTNVPARATKRVREPEPLLGALLAADSEAQVIELLRESGYWDDDAVWRSYADNDSNFSSAGNQQRNPEAALVEKLINSVDASLMRRCMEAGLDPRSDSAPPTIREAVAIFYEGADATKIRDHQGYLAEWTREQRTRAAREITLSITGPRAELGGAPSITIADSGEGQAPEQIPDTILSLNQGIKQSIKFVQGKFNMGGTGALRFCGRHNLQLVVSKRDPKVAANEGCSTDWGFTVVRRDDPDQTSRVSIYRYLAPVGAGASPRHGELLHIQWEELAIFPEAQNAYARKSRWGTLIKLYEYDTRFKTHLFRRGGLQERLDLYIPGLALPIRLHECRDYRGVAGSFETTLAGLQVRLAKSDNLEKGFPDSGELLIAGESIAVTIYAFKRGAAATYRRNEGVMFVVNGQTHAFLADRFFRRQSVGMGYLADSLLVLLDCSDLSGRTKEELFMNSRDRLADVLLARTIEEELADLLARHDALRALREQRRQEDTASKIANEKPFEDALRAILKRSPSLSKLFLAGTRLSNPFSQVEVSVGKSFEGKPHPTLFKFKDRAYGTVLERTCHLDQRLRLTLETDVVNDYFKRRMNPGKMTLSSQLNETRVLLDYSLNLHDGFAHLNVRLPDGARPGDDLKLSVNVADPTLIEPFINQARLTILPTQEIRGGVGGTRDSRKEPDENSLKELRPAGIAFPKVTEVTRDRWSDRKMDEYSALRVVQAGDDDVDSKNAVYDFFVNVDNIFLQSEIKASRRNSELLRAQFKFGMALIGLGVIRQTLDQQQSMGSDSDSQPIDLEELVSLTTDALAPMLIPMIETLSDLDLEELAAEGEDPGDGTEP